MSTRAEETTLRYYEERADEFVARTGHLDLSSRYEPFLALVPHGGTILDAGCGPGRDVAEFLRRGYQVTAFDASDKMVQLATQRTGIAVMRLRFQDMTFDQPFDGVWASASLLHVPLTELSLVFENLRRALRMGGVGFMSFKEGQGERFDDGRHFLDFTAAVLHERLQAVPGIAIVRVWITPDEEARPNVQWVNALFQRVS